MKLAIILTVIFMIGAIVYWRIRPYLAIARRVMATMRAIQSGGERRGATGVSGAKGATGEKLIRCESCGVWLPASRALEDRSSGGSSYCSTDCLEKSLVRSQRQRRSAVR
ncbi:MAG: hypothetical protein H0V88_13925 [Pyrinomonadaceae bacterium]|nr:hypothetical protein [Pyrinomonadaceae bacterium]